MSAKTRSALIVVCGVIALAACERSLNIAVLQAQDSPPVFRFSEYGSLHGAEVHVVWVGRRGEPGAKSETYWSLRTVPYEPVSISDVSYGSVPSSFAEEVRARPLERGQTYEVMAGGPGKLGSSEFTVK
jgi:hypothetical protein